MNARCRGALMVGLAVTMLPSAASSQLQQPPARGDDPGGAARYFHDLRALPSERIPPRARQIALSQMRARWPRAFAQRDALSTRVPGLPSSTTWTQLGPAPIASGATTSSGRLNSIAIHPTDPNTIYIGGAQGGVWKTTDGGASWIPLTDSQCSLAMGSVVLDPVNPNIIYAGTGEQNNSQDSYYGCGVLRSIDGGQSWVELGKSVFDLINGGRTISRVVVDRATAGTANATTVLVAASNGIFRSTDSGNTWTAAADPVGRISDLIADPTNAGVYYAAVGHFSLSAAQVPGISANGIFKSSDSGLTWTRVSKSPIPAANVGRINLAISTSSPQAVYAAIEDASVASDGALLGIYVTTDGGDTWSARSATSPSGPLCGTGLQCWYDMVIAVDPSNSSIVYFGGVSLYRSLDGAATFQDIGLSIHVDQHAFAFHPGVPTTVYAGNDGGIFKSTNSGSSWTSLNTNLALTQFYSGVSTSPTSTTTILAGTQDNGTLQWGGAVSWPQVLGADGGFTAIDQLTGVVAFSETQWSATFGGPRRRDIPGGQFVQKVDGINMSDRAQFIPPFVMDQARPRIVFFGTSNLYRSANSGDSWARIGTNLVSAASGVINTIGVAASDSLTAYVGSNDGRVSYTHDLGETWSIASGPSGRPINDIAVDPRDARTAIVVLGGFGATNRVWRTTDGGLTWTDLSGNLPNIPVLAVVLEPGSRDITIGTDLGVFTLRSGTSSWDPVVNGLPNVAVYDLVFDAPRNRLIAATHGRGMFSLDVTITALRGDVTGDGQVTALDAQAILAMVVGNTPPSGSVRFPNGDANCDGQVTALDALIVLRKAAGITDAGVCVGTIR